MNNVNKPGSRSTHQPDYDEEAAEVLRMKNECDRMAHELIEQIDCRRCSRNGSPGYTGRKMPV